MQWFEEHIAHYEGVQGGAAVIRDTRTPVSTIVSMYPVYDSSVARIVDALPHLSEADVYAALAYYRKHQQAIDADIQRHEHALQVYLAASR
ncbi:MAG: DUF433 domain-containing protein [Chloroflexota bacterium]